MSNTNPDSELTLNAFGYSLRVSPYGASLRGLRYGDRQVVTGYHGKDGKVGGQGDVLIPFPGRVTAGHYEFEGSEHQMALNDHEGPNAIHGFLRTEMWDEVFQTDSSVRYRIGIAPDQHPGYPFSLSVEVTYTLSATGLATHTHITNTGAEDAPVACGNHPYFTVGTELIDTAELELPFESYLEYKDLVPTGKVLPVEGTASDFHTAHPIGTTKFNTCFMNPKRSSDGNIHIKLTAPEDDGSRAVTVWLGTEINYVVLYSGDPLPESHRRRALAIEPMSCGSDAFNHPTWGLIVLPAGQTWTGIWGVTAS